MPQGLQEVSQLCPYCGEVIELLVDGSVEEQLYVEDCFVCCRPIQVHAYFDAQDNLQLELNQEGA